MSAAARALGALVLAALLATACDDGSRAAEPQPQAPQPAQQQAAPAPQAESLGVDVRPAADTVVLGGEIRLQVTVTNAASALLRVNVPRLDRSCATVRARVGDGAPVVLERLYADITPRGLAWQAPETRELKAGESFTSDVVLQATRTGVHHLTVQYRPSVADPVRTCDPVTVSVEPDGAKTRLGMRIGTSKGPLLVRLRPDLAPNAVDSFVALARKGFYDGLGFHRIIAGFMAQGGDPQGTGGGGPGWFLPLEAKRDLLHRRGVLSMARTNHPDTAGSQFFLMFTDYPSLDPGAMGPGYTAFGEMVEGEETLKALESVETTIPEDVRKQLEARGTSKAQIAQYVQSGQIEKSVPVEKVTIDSMKIVTLD